MNARLRLLLLYFSLGLAFLGGAVFVVGILIELFSSREIILEGTSSSAIQIAFAGLCLAGLMFAVWFALIGWMLARQSREQGSGYGDAYRLIESFRFREAIPLLERSIKEGKETSEVLMLLTSAYAYAGQLGKAQATADRAVHLFPDDPGSYITLANGYRLQAAYDEAARALILASELEPDQPVIWAELGFVQRFAGDATGALHSFNKAATYVMPAMYAVRVYYHLAEAFQADGDVKGAVSAMAKMVSARDGLATWVSGLNALHSTAYGGELSREVAKIQEALAEADAATLG